MLKNSTIQLLRLKFSFFIMPVYWFGLSQVEQINIYRATAIFFILHLILYPASNAYNSYMDRDTDPIGGLEKPPLPEKELYTVSIVLDIVGLAASFFHRQIIFLSAHALLSAHHVCIVTGESG